MPHALAGPPGRARDRAGVYTPAERKATLCIARRPARPISLVAKNVRPEFAGDEACYCLVVQRGRLHFTGPVPRILNLLGG